jgi:hypothetical protein
MMFSYPAGWEPAPEVLPARDTIYDTERNMVRERERREKRAEFNCPRT